MTRRVLGVTVGVPEPHAGILQKWRRTVGDPQAELMWPHVTLLPPTAVVADVFGLVDAHLEHAAKITEPFVMHLSGTGTFRPVSPVVYIQVSRGVASCEVLERIIRCGPLERHLDFPYHPHVTVAQDVSDAALDEAYEGLANFTARFSVESFQLYQRLPDGAWKQIREYSLGAP
jgi:2'-5' RNA ligase